MAHVNGLGAFFIIVAVAFFAGLIGWVIHAHLRARRLGLPPPSLSSYIPFRGSDRLGPSGSSSGGVAGWFSDKMRALKGNNRSAGGAYEEPLSSNVRGRASNRGFGPLDPDDAWDARVGTEADAYGPGGYFEEQELGLRSGRGAGLAPTPDERGRSLSRGPEPYIGGSQAGLDRRYDEEMGKKPATNPFGDAAEPSDASLRGVSPRPFVDTSKGKEKEHKPTDSSNSSPTERRSLFREDV